MEYQRKKKLTNFTIGLLFLSGGIEYAVILPTIWAYLQTLHAEPYFLGLGISAFSLTGLLAGPLFGHWSDRSQRTKAIILFANVFEIMGNFMYFMGISKWLLLGSRLVAGVGTGAGASIFGYLTRSTTSQERAKVFAAVMACRQVGLLIGPACNLFLRLCNFRLGPFEVNKFTSPGLFMCLLWILLQFVVAVMYYDLQPVPHLPLAAQQEEEREPLVQHGAGQDEPAEHRGYGGTGQRTPPEGDESRYVPNGHLAEEEGRVKEKSPFQNFSAMREYLREEVVVLLTAQFITLFNQTALETMVTPITQRYLSFGELENSIMYFLCGIEVICGFFLVRCLSSRLPDRVVLVLGLVICNVACVWCLLFLARPQGAGAALRGCLPGLALLQGHSRENTRVQPGPAAVSGGSRHHSGAPVGWRPDRKPLHHAGGDDGPAEPADGHGRTLILLPGGAAPGLRARTVPGGAALVTSRPSAALRGIARFKATKVRASEPLGSGCLLCPGGQTVLGQVHQPAWKSQGEASSSCWRDSAVLLLGAGGCSELFYCRGICTGCFMRETFYRERFDPQRSAEPRQGTREPAEEHSTLPAWALVSLSSRKQTPYQGFTRNVKNLLVAKIWGETKEIPQ
ncbi:uncharacterized protein LOC144270334 isoform X1 [Eretmochelys imbricata]